MTRHEPLAFCLTEAVETIHVAADDSSLRSAMAGCFAQLGYDHFILGVDIRSREEFGNAPTLTTWSDDAMKQYRTENFAGSDPLLAHAWNSDEPVQWSGEDEGAFAAASEGNRRYGDFLRSLPLRSGIVIPLSRSEGRVSAISIGSQSDLRHEPNVVRDVAALAKVAVMKAILLGIPRDDSQGPRIDAALSSRQVEILQWAARGKSNADIAVITGQSKRAVDYHVSEILRKLKVSSRAQAVALIATTPFTKPG